jgi:hypothetical protein
MVSSLSLYNVIWSAQMTSMFAIVSGGTFGSELASVACFQIPYDVGLALNVMSPVLVFLPLAVAIVAGRRIWSTGSLRPAWHSMCRGVLVTTLLAYASMTSAALKAFHCEKINGKNLVVASGFVTEYESDNYALGRAVAVIGVTSAVLIPVAMAGVMLWAGKYCPQQLSLSGSLSGNEEGGRGDIFKIFGFTFAVLRRPVTGQSITSVLAISSIWESVR